MHTNEYKGHISADKRPPPPPSRLYILFELLLSQKSENMLILSFFYLSNSNLIYTQMYKFRNRPIIFCLTNFKWYPLVLL